eukprot:TRINITY_DN4368_c0_g2_i1.p1 TRINITY_DN4368_c0_g2~~TRINITY_DN4368_c0_g2_i1.p1  ORF type:complete len:535 (-),score=44.04 TRINITY_DN4368_c0_g2_i1:137-1570(-)
MRLVGPQSTLPSKVIYVSVSPQCRHLMSGTDDNRIYVESIFIHSKYSEYGVNFDIAIVSLLGRYLGPTVVIDDGSQDYKAVTSIGYGLIRPEEERLYAVQPLQGANLVLVSEILCKEFLDIQSNLSGQDSKKLSDSLDYKNMVCAYDLKADTCEGDSGGPLLHDSTIVGIVSWGPSKQCSGLGDSATAAVFTRVSQFYSWIYQMMMDHSVGATLPQPPTQPLIVPITEQRPSVGGEFQAGNVEGSQVKDVSTYPFSSVGRLKKGCSASVLGPNHILTVAHCIFNVTTGEYTDNLELDFALQQNGQEDTAAATFKIIYPFIPKGWFTGRTFKEKYRHNYAVLLVDGNLTQYVPQTWSFQNTCNENLNLNIIGYPDEKNKQMWYSSCEGVFVNCTSNIMYHDCYAAKGMGGSPMFKVSEDSSGKQSFDIVGVHFGYSRSIGKQQAVALDEQAKQQIQDWIMCDYDCVVETVSGTKASTD